jgi:predicted histidine transporter YuiF (NhaC family)
VIDSIYVSLCIELGFDSSYELLTGILGVAYVAGTLMAGVAVVVESSLVPG